MAILLNVTVAVTLLALLILYVRFKLVTSRYWSDRSVPHLPPVFLLGNLWRTNITENVAFLLKSFHLSRKRDQLLGLWIFFRPILMVTDPALVKRILVRDFNHFRDRGFEVDADNDPLAGHLFLLNGKKWRNLRVKLTPTFTSGKMKMMFPTMVKCGKELESHLRAFADSGDAVEAKDLLARFTTDVISSCAFGIETNSLQNPESEFRRVAKAMEPGLRTIILGVVFAVYPSLLTLLKIRFLPDYVNDFFLNTVRDTVEYREKNNIRRNDFLQLIIQLMRAGKVEDVDKTPLEGLTDDELVHKFSLEEAAAQCFVFFVAGFETSSAAMTFCLYELALNPDIQTRLQSEIDAAGDEITYDGVCEMEYLDMVVQEALRKYPPLANLQRKCERDYHIPELNVTVEKGVTVMVSVLGIHYDPDVYPDPEKFDPERFAPDERNKRDACVFLPFGEGPRNCIGNRFGLMQVKIGLISILRRYRVEVCKETPIPVRYKKGSFTLQPEGGIPLTIRNRV